MTDARTRTLEALEIVADTYGLDDLDLLCAQDDPAAFQAATVAMLAEAIAAILIEVKPSTVRGPYGPRR